MTPRKTLSLVSLTVAGALALSACGGGKKAGEAAAPAPVTAALAKAGVNIRVIDQGSSEMNIIVGVEEKDLVAAVRAIYEAFEAWEGRS